MKKENNKIRYSLITPEFTKELAEVLMLGSKKYGDYNWKTVENGKRVYLDSLLRHVESYRLGEPVDPESGKSTLAHVAANCMILMWFEGPGDDRELILDKLASGIEGFIANSELPVSGDQIK